ncbi:NUDIX domain-containing protein [Kitasatospora sp. NPDC091335]|uniref:NUDIX domain-containing protein n=1 Tax=Kitasatospora sp. NPDC091335 TaxID=3364085 RepID=UPI0037F86EC4
MNSKDIRRPERWVRAEVLIRNVHGRVLLMEPTDRPGFLLPGGLVRPGEQVADGAARELAEQTGLRRLPTHHLGVDQVPANPATGDVEGFSIVCDGGDASLLEMKLLAEQGVPVAGFKAFSGHRWASLDELNDLVDSYMLTRLRVALGVLDGGLRQPLLYMAQPAPDRRNA